MDGVRFVSGDVVGEVQPPIWKKVLEVLTDVADIFQKWINSSWIWIRNDPFKVISSLLAFLPTTSQKDGDGEKSPSSTSEDKEIEDQKHDSQLDVLSILPKELWLYVSEKIENPEDWLNFIRMSYHLEKLMEPAKTEKLFPEILKHIVGYLDVPDLLNLRAVSKKVKQALDAQGTSTLDPFLNTLPSIYLTDLNKVSRFTKEMNNNGSDSATMSASPIPFSVLVGAGSPSDPDCRDLEDEYLDQLTCQVFWKAFARSTEKIGQRITSIVLDIRIDPQHGLKFAESIVNVIVKECLPGLPNINSMVIITNTMNVEKALAGVYSIKDSSDFPSLPKLESLEIITLGEGHPSKAKFKNRQITFPSRFLRKHGNSVRRLRVYSNLYDFRTMDTFQVPKLETVYYEIHHCQCQGKEADLKALLTLPVIKQEEDESVESTKPLKTITIKVNWQWRTSDMSCILKWIGKNYPYHQLEKVTLRNSQNPVKSLSPHVYDHKSHRHAPPSSSSRLPRQINGYGSDFPWLNKLTLPPIQHLELFTEYSGSWEFLKAIRGNLEHLRLQKQIFFRNEEEMKEIYKQGYIKKIFSVEVLDDDGNMPGSDSPQETIIWNYFPRLKELSVVWRDINYKNINWDIEMMLSSEAFKYKDIVSKKLWKFTRQEYRVYLEDEKKSNGGDCEKVV